MSDHAEGATHVLQDVSLPAQPHTEQPCGRSSLGWQVIHLAGELDLECVSRLRRLCRTAGPRVVLDLTQVTFMDASGLGVLAVAGERARSMGGAVRLVGASRGVRRIVLLTRLDELLAMFDTVQEALDGTTVPSRPASLVIERATVAG